MKKNSTNIIIAVVAVLAVALIVVYGARGRSSSSGYGSASVDELSSTQFAPDFSLERLNGENITLAQYRGVKPVVLDFWATWCPNCQRDMPRLNAMYNKYKDQVEVIGINLQENPNVVARFINDRGINFPIAFDPSSRASKAYGVRYTNFHVLIDIDGNVIRTIPGDIRESDITALINLP